MKLLRALILLGLVFFFSILILSGFIGYQIRKAYEAPRIAQMEKIELQLAGMETELKIFNDRKSKLYNRLDQVEDQVWLLKKSGPPVKQ